MSLRTRRLPRAPRRHRTAGARVALACAVAAALTATCLGVVAPAAAIAPTVTRVSPLIAAGHAASDKIKKKKKRAAAHHHGKKTMRHKHKHKPKPVWSPRDSTVFNYPFSPRVKDRYRIRRHVFAAVQGAPRGSQIRLATFTFVDEKLTGALIAAYRRGVSVQVLVNRKDVKLSPPFHHLREVLGHSRRGDRRTPRARASFARTCSFSCRGTRGNLHSKIYLFSQVGHRRWVSMVGSANLNIFAAEAQWNHLNTITGRATYQRLRHVFNQMRQDRPRRHPFETFTTPKTVAWVFPRPGTTARNDPMMRILSRVNCRATSHTGVRVPPKPGARGKKHHQHKKHPKKHKTRRSAGKSTKHANRPRTKKPITRRTVIRIAMYAWFDDRGNALAKAVRQKWNQGCDVRVIYSVLNGKVKRILYNPSGRGRIPMRRSIVPDELGNVLDYNHSKYVAVNGRFAGKGRELVWTGSMNFTQLGLASDDIIVRLSGHKVYRSYLRNFSRVWHAPTARMPVPTRR